MTNTEDIGILLWGIGYKSELRVTTGRTAELEDVSLVLDDIDVDVPTTKWHDSCASVYGVLVLSHLDRSV